MSAFSITKMVKGLFTGSHWGKTISFLFSAGFLLFIGIGVWRGFFKAPAPRTDQKAQEIKNYHYNPQPRFGCATVRVYERFNPDD